MTSRGRKLVDLALMIEPEEINESLVSSTDSHDDLLHLDIENLPIDVIGINILDEKLLEAAFQFLPNNTRVCDEYNPPENYNDDSSGDLLVLYTYNHTGVVPPIL